ncbi:MAG: TlpA disulfide reductase family protein [Bacteroidales bacterium]|nr:TlpA disulfide reductase family protein [Bacteroidales bacterium]
MKKLLFILLTGFVITSCESEPEHFTVSGKIKNGNGTKLYLVELQKEQLNFLDSIILNEEGSFRFTGNTEIPKFYALRTSPGNYLSLIINPREQITIHADVHNLVATAQIEGSEDSRKVLELRRHLDQTISQMDSIGLYYQSIIGTRKLTQKVKDSLVQLSDTLIARHKKRTTDFIEENAGSLAGLMALYQQIAPRRYVLDPVEDLYYFALTDSVLRAKYPASEPVKLLSTQVQDARQQLNAQKRSGNRVGIGAPAPEIGLPNPQGDTIYLSSLQGKYVLLDFWASWCRPCRVENPHLVKVYEKYHSRGFEIFQVSLDKKKQAWIEAIDKDQLNWIHVSDLKYWDSAPAKLYQVQSIPANFLIDPQGKIIAKNLRGEQLNAELSKIFD